MGQKEEQMMARFILCLVALAFFVIGFGLLFDWITLATDIHPVTQRNRVATIGMFFILGLIMLVCAYAEENEKTNEKLEQKEEEGNKRDND